MNPLNIDTLKTYIEESCRNKSRLELKADWVLWMLDLLKSADDKLINPEWLRATHRVRMFVPEGTIMEDDEPPMFYIQR